MYYIGEIYSLAKLQKAGHYSGLLVSLKRTIALGWTCDYWRRLGLVAVTDEIIASAHENSNPITKLHIYIMVAFLSLGKGERLCCAIHVHTKQKGPDPKPSSYEDIPWWGSNYLAHEYFWGPEFTGNCPHEPPITKNIYEWSVRP